MGPRYWSQTNGVFRFVRVEDIAYDKRAGMCEHVYVADSGRGTAGATRRRGRSTNGRIWKLVLDPDDPTEVTSLSIFVEGDDMPVKTLARSTSPTTSRRPPNSLFITEDPGSSQQFTVGRRELGQRDDGASLASTTSRPGRRRSSRRSTSRPTRGPTDVDAAAKGNLGAWESSGVVDASAAFGPGAFLVTVQAHTLWVDKAPGDDNVAPAGPDFTYKREGGQLVLVRVPGA